MKSEPLDIHDKRFLVNRLIQQAPTNTLVREFFKNAEESAALAEEGKRLIKIYPVEINGVRKLAFWNTGPGMNEIQLRQATDLSSSINKPLSLDGNFGIGAKVSGLTMSRCGIRYRSCTGERVHEVTIGYDEELETYVRFQMELPDGSFDTVYEITGSFCDDDSSLSYDWTEVVLYGESDDHDTVSEPLGKGKKKLDRSFIPTAIFQRFSSFSPGIEVRIDVSMTKGGGRDETGRSRRLRTLADISERLERHELVYDESSGISVRYIHDPKHENSSHALSARANPATASTTFCALVHKAERYDLKNKKAWSSAAPNFGIPFGSKVLTIEIFIPANEALPNQYRDGLTWQDDRSRMTAEDFSDYVRELMPEWVKAVIQSESPDSNDSLDDLQSDLQKLLDEFRVPTTVLKPARNLREERAEHHEAGQDTPEDTDLAIEDAIDDAQDGTGKPLQQGGRAERAKDSKMRKAPEGSTPSRSSKALERVPDIQILMTEQEIEEKSLRGRAGRFYPEAQTLFINGLYPVVNRMTLDLEKELRGTYDPELVREIALNASRRSMAFRVGKAACFAISKKLSDDWNMDDLEKATTPESLSMAADDYSQSLKSAKKWAKEQLMLTQISATAQ